MQRRRRKKGWVFFSKRFGLVCFVLVFTLFLLYINSESKIGRLFVCFLSVLLRKGRMLLRYTDVVVAVAVVVVLAVVLVVFALVDVAPARR